MSSKKPINSCTQNRNKNKKRKKHSNDRDSDYVPVPEPSSSAFCRVFSPSQELSILQGMIDFKKQEGSYPTSSSSHMKSFLNHLQDLRVVDHRIQISQLSGKIRRLKNKFKDHRLSTATPPPDPLLDSHLFNLFELSNKIWGQPNATQAASTNQIVQEKNNAGDPPDQIRLTKGVMNLLKHFTMVVSPHDEERNEGPHYAEEENENEEDDVYDVITEFEDEFDNAYPNLNTFLEGQGGKVLFKKKLDSIGADELDEIERECKQVIRLESKAGRHAARAVRKLRTKLLSD